MAFYWDIQNSTTGIGSLPHACVDSAIEFAFRFSIPFLPQIPVRNPKESMIIQALEGIPGISEKADGSPQLDLDLWKKKSGDLSDSLKKAFKESNDNPLAFQEFDLTPEYWSCWTPFLWECEERKVELAKIQLAGPMTCQWALRLDDDSPANRHADVSTQVFRFTLARSLAMARRLQAINVQPLLYLDEPGFYGFAKSNPKHIMALNELKLFIQTLKKESILVGIHCCSNTDWPSLLSLGMDVLSIDTHLSLNLLVGCPKEVESFVQKGGHFSFGIVPTGAHTSKLQSFQPKLLFEKTVETLSQSLPETLVKQILSKCLITPACGLALHSIADSECIFSYISEIQKLCREYS